jgi:anti-sigma B factor antagonist
MSDELTLSREDVPGLEVVRVEGEVDAANADTLQAALEATRGPAVALDLARVSFLDSAGIRAIEWGVRRILADARSFVIVAPDASAAHWTLVVAGFDRARVLPSVGEALSRVGPGAHGA